MNKNQVLYELESIMVAKYGPKAEKIFSNIKEYDDKEIKEKIKEVLRHLVKKEKITAAQGAEIVTKYFPKLIKPKKITPKIVRKEKKEIQYKPNHLKTPIGPFKAYGFDQPVIIDAAKMGFDWTTKMTEASREEKQKIMLEYITDNDRQI